MPEKMSVKIQRENRRLLVAANLLAGATYREIAAAAHVSIGTVSNDVTIILGRWEREQVQDTGKYVKLELRRLDVALNAIWDKVRDGHLGAIDRMIAIMNKRAKLMGLDKPLELTLTDDEIIRQYKDLLAQIAGTGAAGKGDQA